MLRADHHWQLILSRTPKVRVAAELSLQACTLRERYPGARAQAPRRKDAKTERRPRPCRLDDGALADANKQKQRWLRHWLSTCLGKTVFVMRNFCSNEVEKWEARNNLQCLWTLSLVCPQWTVLRNKSKTDNSAVNVICVRAKNLY